jgi:hypothetical protein
MKSIKTLAGLQRAWNASNKQAACFYKRPYILAPALARHIQRLDCLEQIDDAAARYQAFRLIPSLESELQAIDSSLLTEERLSLAQRHRAMRPRVRLTSAGHTLEGIIYDLLNRMEDPWRQKAKQYWHPLSDRLRELGLNPSMHPYPADPSNERLRYDRGGKYRWLTPRQFENIVCRVRRRLSRERN